jgi:Cys-rich protein (TIGR01571 family)
MGDNIDFDSSLFGCFEDCNICLCSFFCGCVQFAKNVEVLHERGEKAKEGTPLHNFWANCIVYFCLCVCPYAIYPFFCVPRAGTC